MYTFRAPAFVSPIPAYSFTYMGAQDLSRAPVHHQWWWFVAIVMWHSWQAYQGPNNSMNCCLGLFLCCGWPSWQRWCTWLDEVEYMVVVVIRYYISIVKKDITKKYIPKSSRHVESRAPLLLLLWLFWWPGTCWIGLFWGYLMHWGGSDVLWSWWWPFFVVVAPD